MLTYTDMFCGAGGSSIGLTEAGMLLCLAMNHWDRAIETHAANFPDAEHWCEDVNRVDMRRLPKTDVLWASPICTEISPAGGRRRRTRAMDGQGDLLEEFGPVAASAFDRTRATAFDVIRATEVHRYLAVIIENVVEFATDWELFRWWLDGMVQLGYNHQTVSVSSAHVGDESNPWAPQWRDRLYIVFTRVGIPLPDVAPRPIAWCEPCAQIVRARQWWKKGPDSRGVQVGKYRTQYLYRCPNAKCRHSIVEPYVLPAASAIDWSDLGQRIGDRARPLAAATVRRIEVGIATFCRPAVVRGCGTDPADSAYVRAWPADGEPLGTRLSSNVDGLAVPPMLVPAGGTWNDEARSATDEPFRTRTVREMEGLVVNVNHDDDRTYPAGDAPLATRSTKIGDGVATAPFVMVNRTHNLPHGVDEPAAPVTTGNSHGLVSPEPFITMLRNNQTATGADEPLTTVSAAGRHHGLTVPPGAFYVKNYGGHAEPRHMVKDVGQPLGVVTGQDHHALVIPYRRANRPTTTGEPLHTLHAKESAGLLRPDVAVDDCHFRMLQPREHLRAQRFGDDYIVTGNRGEQTMQAGNAVSANVAHWLARQVMVALDSRSAA